MAGDKHVLKIDPAIERYAEMRSSQYMYFRWTPKTVTKSIVLGVVVPLFIGYFAFATEGKWDFRGKGINDKLTENRDK
ncbi:unnamed protein product [Pneumocystis jirovecii]|uniref:NADH dehydrogenase [ubiquinone] 1 beta subcomplex subunit 4 n=2 Tax=Pneumocystis jirovecii TaxID=42068 RepID=L0PEJ5_PNEJI|nr:uncharacterized protein T551_01031 [Pneumocystis jirovecii RU7]KTW31770.1 hypothetical protein T551_01031 [Pneumocystis jirovecii RU7]CCJ30788.1 unnamed protein product [Pneumocystis jirovecii]